MPDPCATTVALSYVHANPTRRSQIFRMKLGACHASPTPAMLIEAQGLLISKIWGGAEGGEKKGPG